MNFHTYTVNDSTTGEDILTGGFSSPQEAFAAWLRAFYIPHLRVNDGNKLEVMETLKYVIICNISCVPNIMFKPMVIFDLLPRDLWVEMSNDMACYFPVEQIEGEIK